MTTAPRRKPMFPTPLALACALLCHGAAAQIRTDGTVGPAQVLQGPAYQIPQALGRLAGANLFHSFSAFSVGSGESATFTTSTPGIANVISRVTGGSPSQIDGTLRLSAADGAPALFFINPAGVAFGAGAQVDVPGAFHVGTADYVRFPDGRLYADPARGSTFSSAPPEAFGFLGTQRATLAVQGGAEMVARLTQPMTLAAGDILVDASTVAVGGGAELRLVAMGLQAGEVPFGGALPAGGGVLAVRGGSYVATLSALPGAPGRLRLSAGDVLVEGSQLQSRGSNDPQALGTGGDIEVRASGTVALTEGGAIESTTYGTGDAGAIAIQAGQVRLAGGSYIFSGSSDLSGGRAGAIDVTAAGLLSLQAGSSISTEAYGQAAPGAIALRAGELWMDGGEVVSRGTAGASAMSVAVQGALVLQAEGRIATFADGDADAGAVNVQAGSLQLRTRGFIGSLTNGGGAAGHVDVAVQGDALMQSGGWILSSSAGTGDAGGVTLSAANLRMDAASITSNTVGENSAARAGDIAVQVAGRLALTGESSIDTSTLTHGRAGDLRVRAADIVLDGQSRLNSRALNGSGDAGLLDVAASGSLVLRGASSLSTTSSTAGNAGEVRVQAASIDMDGNAAIDSLTGLDSLGRGGNVQVTTSGLLRLRDKAHITTIAGGVGHAGNVQIQADAIDMDSGAYVSAATEPEAIGNAGRLNLRAAGDIAIRGGAFVNSDVYGTGDAGQVELAARNITVADGGRISSVSFSNIGSGGRIAVQASGELAVLGGAAAGDPAGTISTSTFGQSDGGAITIDAGSVRLAGRGATISSFAQEGSTGNAGRVDVQASGLVHLSDGAGISTSTASLGDGGAVNVRAAEVYIGSSGGVFSSTLQGSQGRAGSIDVRAVGNLSLQDGVLSSSTYGTGAAGSVRAQAARIVLEGAQAYIDAADPGGRSGQTGSVSVLADESITLRDGAVVSIGNFAVLADPARPSPTTLRMAAPRITLQGGSLVTAASSGNVAASAIVVEAGQLQLDGSGISTAANDGNGGAITVRADTALQLRRSAIMTSVFGTAGDGGDIAITTPALALESGFIQANTAARDAAGGLVRIDVGGLVASGNTLLLGGDQPYAFQPLVPGFNVIQAAAPTGVSGVVEVTSPVLDVTGSLRGLGAQVIDSGGLGRSLCQASGGSALAQGGRGGLAPSSRGFLRAEGAPGPLAGLHDRPAPVALAGLRTVPRGCL